MVVKFEHTSDTDSNKTDKYAVAINCNAYWYERPTGFKVTILKPMIDNLSLTLHIHDEYRQAIPKGLWDMAKDGGTPEYVNSKAEFKGSNEYKTSVSWIDPGGAGTVLIQCQPKPKKDKAVPFMRFELNPDRLGAEGLSRFKEEIPVILLGNGSWKMITTQARITRLDIAVDLLNIDIENLLIGAKKPGKKISYFGIGGKVETAYFNVTKHRREICVYDKKQAQKDKKIVPEFEDTPHTRVEIRTSSKRPIIDLPKVMNHLKKVEVIDIESAEPPEKDHIWSLFQDACRYRGLDGALEQFPEDIREAYREAVLEAAGVLWRPHDLWEFWPETVEKSGLLDP